MPEKTKKHDKIKPRKVKFQYPAEAINTDDPFDRLIYFGRKFSIDEKEALISCDISMSIDQVSQLTFLMSDPDFTHSKKGIYEPGIMVKFEDLLLDAATIEMGSAGGQPALTVRCRPRAVRQLKKRTGHRVMKNVSASEFIDAECGAIGARCVTEPTSKRKQVARDTKREGRDAEAPSSWTTFQRLASEEGFYVFEAGNVIYFGKPTWFMDRFKDDVLKVNWNKDDATTPINVPRCTRNEDTVDGGTTIEVDMFGTYGRKFRPGRVLELDGVPGFNRKYLIFSVDYSLLQPDIVHVQAGTPIDPEKPKVAKGGDGGGDANSAGQTSSLRFLLDKVGFKGDNLEVAMAVAMAESGGDAHFSDRTDHNDKWGAYCGLFAIRSMTSPNKYEGVNRRRVRKRLMDGRYNAELVFDLSNGGKDWSDWTSYTDGSYKKWYKKKKTYTVKNWHYTFPKKDRDKGDGQGGGGGGGGAAGGAKSAGLFVSHALAQTGDRYVFGAEASVSDPNPDAFDCSELVQWAAGRAGVPFTDGSSAQIAACHGISVDQAIRTRGALLWHPGHIAISLGNGRTIEAANPGFGVGQITAYGRFQRGGLIPGMRY